MSKKDVDLDDVLVWVQIGTKIVQMGYMSYVKLRKLFAESEITDAQMADADAEYQWRIELARAQQREE